MVGEPYEQDAWLGGSIEKDRWLGNQMTKTGCYGGNHMSNTGG